MYVGMHGSIPVRRHTTPPLFDEFAVKARDASSSERVNIVSLALCSVRRYQHHPRSVEVR